MSRIAATFHTLSQNNRKALIPFITAGDPEPTMTVLLMHELVNVGADIIELGVPFSGSLGPTEKSHYRKDRRPYQKLYTPEQKSAVAKLFDQEIEMHGYEF